jgi:signal transduction histidine kinase
MLKKKFIAKLLLIFCVGLVSLSEFTRAQNMISLQEPDLQQNKEIELTQALKYLPDQTQAAQQIQLPDSWNKTGQQGQSIYEINFELKTRPDELWGLYVPRVGNRFEISLNQNRIASLGIFGHSEHDYSRQAQYIQIDPQKLRQGFNKLIVKVEGDKSRYAGLSRMQIGPDRLLRSRYQFRHAFQYGGSMAMVVLALFAGLTSSVVAYLNRDKAFAIFGASCLFFCVRMIYAVVTDLPLGFKWWTLLIDGCLAAYVTCLLGFCVGAVGQSHLRWPKVMILGFMVWSLVLVPWLALGQSTMVRQIWISGMFFVVCAVAALMILTWWRKRDRVSTVLCISMLITVLLSAYDQLIVFFTRDGYGYFALTRYVQALFMLSMAWVLADRLKSQMKLQAQMQKSLEDELSEKTKNLNNEYALREKLTVQHAQDAERTRILRDLHDGLGMHLNVLLSMVEQNKDNPEQIKSEVHTTLEQFRLLLDGSENFDGSLLELLGHIRYRVENMLQRFGVSLNWQITLPDFDTPVQAKSAIDLQRLIFELCSNVVKHAQATQLKFHANLTTQADASGQMVQKLGILIEDNGKGFERLTQSRGLGLKSIQSRLDELEAEHVLQAPQGQGTRYNISIPMSKLLLD